METQIGVLNKSKQQRLICCNPHIKAVRMAVAIASKFDWIESNELFRDLPKDQLQALSDMAKLETKEKGARIFTPEDVANMVYFVVEGRVKSVNYLSDGKEVIKTIAHAGDMFGEMALLGQTTRNDFAVVMDEHTLLYRFRSEDLTRLMNGSAGLSMRITQAIGRKLLEVERKFESLFFKDARARIVEMVKDMAGTRGQVLAGGSVLVAHALTHQDMANMTATSRQTVTTVLNELKDMQVINFDRKSILVHDMHRLT
jgi:CRP/FNR family cyclic AMP-dependent transcriptional regulator